MKLTAQSFMFEALEGHVDPAGALIAFTIMLGSAKKPIGHGDWLWLNVKAWGPAEGVHHITIEWLSDVISKDNWVILARKLRQWLPYNL
ncbi:hypothetical protein [Nonomuraea sp. NPDC049480]|uniref:hypothetical protein n=1 Tax=Nonomuraea sp. NPDC049480 TaxID=3364353 RepID=UPI0037931EF5